MQKITVYPEIIQFGDISLNLEVKLVDGVGGVYEDDEEEEEEQEQEQEEEMTLFIDQVAKSFAVSNDNNQSIAVSLHHKGKDKGWSISIFPEKQVLNLLSNLPLHSPSHSFPVALITVVSSRLSLQIIKSGCTAGFDVRLMSESLSEVVSSCR